MKQTVSHWVILGPLAHEPRSGYEIKAIVDRSTRFFWELLPRSTRVQREGLVEVTRWAARPPTPAGPLDGRRARAALDDWLHGRAEGDD